MMKILKITGFSFCFADLVYPSEVGEGRCFKIALVYLALMGYFKGILSKVGVVGAVAAPGWVGEPNHEKLKGYFLG
jgi:hypothetical protein